MKLFGIISQPSRQSTSGIYIFLQCIILVSLTVQVKSQCFEEDCTDLSIKVINVTTGECITCFPCLPCPDQAQMLSVPCGSTVPSGTDIHCVKIIQPDPRLVSKASTYTRDVTITTLDTSHQVTSVTMWPTVVSNTDSVVVHPSPTTYPGSSSSSVSADFKIPQEPREKRELPSKKIKKQEDNTLIYKLSGVVLVMTLLAIACRFFKKTRRQFRLLNPSTNGTMSPELCPVIASEQDSDICTVYPESNSAVFSCSQHRGNGNGHFQLDHAVTISPPSDVTHPEGRGDQSPEIDKQEDLNPAASEVLVDLSINPQQSTQTTKVLQSLDNSPSFVTSSVNIIVQPTSTFSRQYLGYDIGSRIAGDPNQRRLAVNWQALSQTDKYSIKMNEVPFRLQYNICLNLDINRSDGKDVREFAEKLGITLSEFDLLNQAALTEKTTTTSIILKERFSGTVGDFIDIMKKIERQDIISLVNDWKG